MGTDEISCDQDMKMTEQQPSKSQQAMPTEAHNERSKSVEQQRAGIENLSATLNGDAVHENVLGGSPRNRHSFIDLVSKSRADAFRGYLGEKTQQQRNDRKNKSSSDDSQFRNSPDRRSKHGSPDCKSYSPDQTPAVIEFTCPACGLYFLNAETYETHVGKYCIALKYLMKNKALEETYLAIHGDNQRSAHRDEVTRQPPTVEKLKNAFYRIQQSLSASRNSQIKESTHDSQLISPAGLNNTKNPFTNASDYKKYRSDSSTPEKSYRRAHESTHSSVLTENDDIQSDLNQSDLNGARDSADLASPRTKPHPLRCVVCDEMFSNELTLRQHVLSKHGINSNHPSSRDIGLHSSIRLHRKNMKHTKSRRFSTVERPVLSLLTGRNIPKLPGMTEEEETAASPRRSPKQSLEGSLNTDSTSQAYRRTNSREDTSRSAKLESNDVSQSQFAIKHFHDDDRRMSCPAVPSVNITLESFPFATDNEEQKHCAECDIKFNSIVNYRAHKKFYCAGRHEQRSVDGNPYRSNSFQLSDNPPPYLNQDYQRAAPRNFGSTTTLASRKRSHFIPLQNTISSTVECNEEAPDDEPRPKKSDTKSPNIIGQSSQNESDPPPQKRYYCEECKISFSKEDTFVAHKKYYCHTRRKDRTSTRSGPSRNPLRKSSGDSNEGASPFDRAPAFNPLARSDNMWRLRDGDRSPSLGNMFPTDNIFGNAGCNISQLLQQQSLVMGNLAMMHPYLMKQYLALRDKVPPEMLGTNGNSPNPYLVNFANNRKLSADESRLRSHDAYSSTPDLSVKNTRRPARQSCAAAICVKQEDNTWEETTSAFARDKERESMAVGLPLDLRRNTPVSSEEEDEQQKQQQRSLSSTAVSTLQPIKGQESPEKDRGESDPESHNHSAAKSNSNNNNGTVEVRHENPVRGRSQTCKNCNTQFTSLSTFIAHKKYYCSGIATSLQSFSSNPVIVKTESSW